MEPKEDVLPQLVVFGSSAGGIEVLGAVLERIDRGFRAPIVVAQHLDPRRPSHLAEILSRRTQLSVVPVDGATGLKPGTVYLLAPEPAMEVRVGELALSGEDGNRPAPSIDRILTSGATAYGEGLTAVILSGTGSDGAVGARHVKAAGGTVVIQNPDTAPYPAMPLAIASSLVDIVADADAIGPLLDDLVATPRIARRGDEEKRVLRLFLDEVRERSGIDFSSYKRGTIMRRLQRRMLATGTDDLRSYTAYLASHPEEFQRLTSSFLIKVTQFFRDTELYDHLRAEVLPVLIEESRRRDHELRLWSAGCATGEEAYSLAILVADVLGDELVDFNVRIFATDVDVDAIAFARRGAYPAGALDSLPEGIRDRHFTKVGDQYEVKKAIRAMTVFGQHDLGQRAPFPRVDLALCRNVLIYFTADLQKRALQLFAFALRDGGYLALGKAESTSPLPEHFVLTEPRLKVYRRQGDRVLIPPARLRDSTPLLPLRLPVARRAGWTSITPPLRDALRPPPPAAERPEQLLLRLPVAVVVVDRGYDVQIINAAARRQLGIHGQAIGEDLIHLLDASVGAEVKKAIDQVVRGKAVEPFAMSIGTPTPDGTELRTLELHVQSIADDGDRSRATRIAITAMDVTSAESSRRSLEGELAREQAERNQALERALQLGASNDALLDANQQLATANAELRSANEELLVANEEVQAATEEVETLNEELQATNEELETLNEELQATVEELNTTNDDLEARTIELQESAVSIEHQRTQVDAERTRLLALLDSLDEPIVVVDPDGAVVKANRRFHEVAGGDGDVPLASGDGSPLRGPNDPRRRAPRETFETTVRLRDDAWLVRGRPLEGVDGGYGMLVFRRAAE